MFARLAAISTLSFVALAAAGVVPRQAGSCNTGAVQCCNSLENVRLLFSAVTDDTGIR